MKAEDVPRLMALAARSVVGATAAHVTPEDILAEWNARELALMTAFARACERHVIERAKAIIKIPGECGACDGKGQCEHYPDDGVLEDCPDCEGLGREPLDWSALDAEIAKENEDG